MLSESVSPPPCCSDWHPLVFKCALLPIILSVWSFQSCPRRRLNVLTVYLESFKLNMRPASFPGKPPPALFKDIKAWWKKQMYVKANKPNAKSTVAKRKINVLIVEDRNSFCMRDPSPWGHGAGNHSIQWRPEHLQRFTQEQEWEHTYIRLRVLYLQLSPNFWRFSWFPSVPQCLRASPSIKQKRSLSCSTVVEYRRNYVTVSLAVLGFIFDFWWQEEWSWWNFCTSKFRTALFPMKYINDSERVLVACELFRKWCAPLKQVVKQLCCIFSQIVCFVLFLWPMFP